MICAACKKETSSLKHTLQGDERVREDLRGKGLCELCVLEHDPDAVLSHYCVECGAPTREGQWIGMEGLKFFQLCLTCDYWVRLMTDYSVYDDPLDGSPVIVQDESGAKWHYVVGPEPRLGSSRQFCGFGGSEMIIEYFDGRTVISHNLWMQGKIPDHFTDRFTANAVIIGVAHGGVKICK